MGTGVAAENIFRRRNVHAGCAAHAVQVPDDRTPPISMFRSDPLIMWFRAFGILSWEHLKRLCKALGAIDDFDRAAGGKQVYPFEKKQTNNMVPLGGLRCYGALGWLRA